MAIIKIGESVHVEISDEITQGVICGKVLHIGMDEKFGEEQVVKIEIEKSTNQKLYKVGEKFTALLKHCRPGCPIKPAVI